MRGDSEVGVRRGEETPGPCEAPPGGAGSDRGKRTVAWEDNPMRGWQPFLTPRQMRLILCQLARTETLDLTDEDYVEFISLIEWFETEVDIKYSIEERRNPCL